MHNPLHAYYWKIIGIFSVVCLVAAGLVPVQAQESSPIDIELSVPAEIGPGQIMDVIINYQIVDSNAGAVINYNTFGPAVIWTRAPEPPNPLVNTWEPSSGQPDGSIKIQLRVDGGTDGQQIRHQVEVLWGDKHQSFEAVTEIKFRPPTPTSTPTARPTRAPTAVPTVAPTATSVPIVVQISASEFVDLDGHAIEQAQVGQKVGVQLGYTSTDQIENVSALVLFEPDIVDLENAVPSDQGYVIEIEQLETEGGVISPLWGQIRAYPEGAESFDLQAIVQLVPHDTALASPSEPFTLTALTVDQSVVLELDATVETNIVRAGNGIVVHATCAHLGYLELEQVVLKLVGLPVGLATTPETQTIDVVPADGKSVERLFTIQIPDDYEGVVSFNVVATYLENSWESEQVEILLAPPSSLQLDAVISQTQMRAGDIVYVNVICSNYGRFVAKSVTIKLIDTSNQLGVLFQDIGDVNPDESRQTVFVLEIPQDIVVDDPISLAAQAVALDGTLSQSEAIPVTIECAPAIEATILTVPNLKSGQTGEIVIQASNVHQCPATDIVISLSGLPAEFGTVPPQTITELAGGTTRHIIFQIPVPDNFVGTFDIQIEAVPLVGGSGQVGMSVTVSEKSSGPLVLVLVILALLALGAVIGSLILYFRSR